jgi:sortase A
MMDGNSHQDRAFVSARAHPVLRCAQYLFFFAGVLALAYAGSVVARRQLYQARQTQQFEQAEYAVKSHPGPLPAPIPEGQAIAIVKIPRLEVESLVVQGDSEKILNVAVGHLPGTALPGQTGNMALAGHRDTVFRALRKVRPGDRILVESPRGTYNYKVESTSVVAPTDLSVLRNSPDGELTLITCYPFSWIGSAPDRFIVRARLD